MLRSEERLKAVLLMLEQFEEQLIQVNQQCLVQCSELTIQEVRAISNIGRSGGIRMREIAEKMYLAVSSMTALIEKLYQKGYVERKRSGTDRRVIELYLTEAGQQRYIVITDAYRTMSEVMLSALTDTEQDLLLKLFGKIQTHLAR